MYSYKQFLGILFLEQRLKTTQMPINSKIDQWNNIWITILFKYKIIKYYKSIIDQSWLQMMRVNTKYWHFWISGSLSIKLGVFPEEEFVLSFLSKLESKKKSKDKFLLKKSGDSIKDNSRCIMQNLGDFIYVIFHLILFFSINGIFYLQREEVS